MVYDPSVMTRVRLNAVRRAAGEGLAKGKLFVAALRRLGSG
jgi:hypothetical protein